VGLAIPFVQSVTDSAAGAISHVGARADSVGIAAQDLLKHIDAPISVKVKIFEYIESIAHAMGVAVGQVWWVLVRQAIFLGVVQLMWGALLVFFGIFLLKRITTMFGIPAGTSQVVKVGDKSYKVVPVKENKSRAILVPAWIASCGLWVIAMSFVARAIPMIFNPGYWALNRVLTAIQGGIR
jgi:hypothetical protein